MQQTSNLKRCEIIKIKNLSKYSWNPESWGDEFLQNLLTNKHCFVIFDEYGFLLYQKIFNDIDILNLVVDPKMRGNGIGENLVKSLFCNNKGCNIVLEVGKTNHLAIKLYEKMGFVIVSKINGYYKNGDACLLMKNNEVLDGFISLDN